MVATFYWVVGGWHHRAVVNEDGSESALLVKREPFHQLVLGIDTGSRSSEESRNFKRVYTYTEGSLQNNNEGALLGHY